MAVTRMRVDMTRCDRWGYCAELLPELIQVDEWGYPVIRPPGVTVDEHVEHARNAVNACPRKALHIERDRAQQGG